MSNLLLGLGGIAVSAMVAALLTPGVFDRAHAAPREGATRDSGDDTIELEVGKAVPSRHGPAYGLLRTLGTFAAASSLVVLAATVFYSTLFDRADSAPVSSSTPVEQTAPEPPTAATLAMATPVATAATALSPVSATPAVRAVLRAVDPSRARRECLAQIESAYLFLGLARQASSPAAYARTTNPQIKHLLAARRPVDPRTLEHIALRMWEQRHAPDRGPQWWSTQYARCEEARVAGAGYVVRG